MRCHPDPSEISEILFERLSEASNWLFEACKRLSEASERLSGDIESFSKVSDRVGGGGGGDRRYRRFVLCGSIGHRPL